MTKHDSALTERSVVDIKQAREVLAKKSGGPYCTDNDYAAMRYAEKSLPAMIDWIEAALLLIDEKAYTLGPEEWARKAAELVGRVKQ